MNQNKEDFSPNIHNCWTDGSYVEVCNESEAPRIFYYSGDHSAVISTIVSGKYESKWGTGYTDQTQPYNCPTRKLVFLLSSCRKRKK